MSIPTRIRAALLGAAVAMITTLVVAAPAQAHDDLVSSTPGAGETLTAAPAAISMEFSGEISPDGLHAEILAGASAAEASGADWAGGAPTADGSIVTVPVKADIPAGSYVAIARVVSSDGHPIEVEVPFTLDLAAPTATPTATATATPAAATATPVAPAIDANAADSAANPTGWIVGGALVVLVLVGGGILLASRNRAGA